MIEIIDTPQPVQRFLPRLGDVHTIIRYITSRNTRGDKHIKIAEVRAIARAGKKLAIVHETWGDFVHAGHGGVSGADGLQDGRYCREVMPKLGAPEGACVYFAVDHDATPTQLKNNVLPYFKAVKEAFDGYYRVGVYGPGSVCKAALDAGYVDLCWLSNAKGWSGYKSFLPHAALVQRLPTRIAGGLDIDPNVAQVEDWGQFTPFADDAKIFPVVAGDDGVGEDEEPEEDVTATVTKVASTSTFKSIIKSKIAWLAGSTGVGGASAAASSDPGIMELFGQLALRPMFWVVVALLVGGGLVVYYRWKDHGGGKA